MMCRALLFPSLVLVSSLALFSQTPPQNPAPPAEDETPVLTVPRDYRYNAKGRRDPFVNPVPKPKPEPAAVAAAAPVVQRPPGLRGVSVADAQIAGVVTSREPSMNVVIIGAPGTRTPYFARVGDRLFDAVVKSISMEEVTFTVTAPGVDPKAPREVVREVRPKAGEEK
jgi:hypothetical protein